MKNTNGKIYGILEPEDAKKFFKETKEDLYKLFSDNVETFIISENDLNDALDLEIEIGLLVGDLGELQEEYDQGAQNRYRNNIHDDFDEWLLEKTEMAKEI